jgi:hypothetical protein
MSAVACLLAWGIGLSTRVDHRALTEPAAGVERAVRPMRPSSVADVAPRSEARDAVIVPPTVERRVQSSVFIEALGVGGLYSLNYDVTLSWLALRVGGSYVSLGATAGRTTAAHVEAVTAPLMASVLLGTREHKLAFGLGTTALWFSGHAQVYFANIERRQLVMLATGFAGYRYVPLRGGLTAQLGFTPLVTFEQGARVLPWGGLAAGWSF